MPDWPEIWLLFATYKRTQAALDTIESLYQYLIYPNIHFHICDDGSGSTDDGTDRDHVTVLLDLAKKLFPGATAHTMPTPPGSFNTGGNINTGIRLASEASCPIHMLNFDDWALTRELDLRPMVDVLENDESVGFIRLSYWVPGLAGVSVRYDAPRLGSGYMWVRLIRQWTLDNPWASDSYMVSTQPYIAHKRFFDVYGYHPEHVNPGAAETGLGTLYNRAGVGEGGPQILFPIGPCTVHAPWSHSVGRANDYAKI